MNLQTHHSGQIGQVPSQAGNLVPGQMQNHSMHHSISDMDPEIVRMRQYMQEKIWQFLMQRRQQSPDVPRKKMIDLVKRLEEGLFKNVTTKEDYLNLATLESRLHVLIKRLPMSSNQNQRFQHANPPSTGTMIPTPGLQQSSNLNMIGTSALDGSLASNNNSSSSNLHSGNFLPPLGNRSADVHGGSFTSSDGLLTGSYQQSSLFSVNSGGNNMVTSMEPQRLTSQMIPTPGFNNSNSNGVNNINNSNNNNNNNNNNQYFMNVESFNNVGAFSNMESTVVSQPMQQKQHVGSQNSRILQNLGGPMGGGIRSTLQQKSYGLANGALNVNGGLGVMGNSMSMMNGPDLTGTLYRNSIKPMHQQPEQHQRSVTQGDGYGMGHPDVSGSGNVYIPVTSAGLIANNQSLNPVMQPMPRANSSLMTNQPTSHSTQHETAMRSQLIDQSDNMNFQMQYSASENLVQPSHQFQQNQNQLLSKNVNYSQFQPSSHIVSQVKSEPETDRHASQVANPFQFSDMQINQDISTSLDQTPDQMQHMMQSLSQQFPCNPQNVQTEFCERLIGKETAHLNNLSSEESMISQSGAPRPANIRRSNNLSREQQYSNQMRWLLFLRHARRCPYPEGQCKESNCLTVQKLWKHMDSCKELHCSYPRCRDTKKLICHHKQCRDANCPVCIPFNNYLLKVSTRTYLNSGSVNGSCKSHDTAKMAGKSNQEKSPATAENIDDIQPSNKRMKIEQGSVELLSGVGEPALHDTHHVVRPRESHVLTKSEITEIKMDHQLIPKISEMKKDTLDQKHIQKADINPVSTDNAFGVGAREVKVVKETVQTIQKTTSLPPETTSKSGKPKIVGVSMTELFTPEQVREHIRGLRQWVGQSKAKVEKIQAMENSTSENSCQLCAVEKLTFEPPPLYCTPCGARIKRNVMYYTIGAGETRHYFCIPCYNEARGDTMVVEGTTIPKARMEKKKNDEETEEWWVQCDKCEAWQHQICALFNGRRNDGGQAEYTCPNCYVEEVERGEREPLPQSAVLGAKDLPRTILSDHIERRLFAKLRQERLDRASRLKTSYDEVPGAESLVVRVVSSVDKKLDVKPRFLEIFQEENYPVDFPYKSKVVLLFQKIEGVEVCLFGMYVQEFGSECDQPNHRRVYLSYLDSVKYFRPDIRAVTGEALRTFVYHEILIGYLEYCKMRGFSSCYIWACPPLKGEDYILYCHPEIQKTPRSDKLREWYLAMLRKASKENIVVELTNLYDNFFMSTGDCKAKVTAARLPYFDGDYWPGAAEDMIFQLQQDEDGRKNNKKGSMKKTFTKRALKASGHQTDLSVNETKDLMLMHKLGETISPMKEDFIMVHLQPACTHCCILMVSGNRWVCRQCKNFELCDRCYDAERKRDDRERHPTHQKDKHTLYSIEITGIPNDTKDKDEILESEFFDTRQAFLSLCQGNHYQYDTLRRAKHSSMMVLYHLHNPTAPAFVMTCNVCTLDIETGQGWRCEICPEYDVCNACYNKEGAVDHPHKLTNHPTNDRDAQNKEARQLRVMQLKKMLELLVHASQCRSPHCQYPNCRKVKGLFRHGMLCKVRASGGCLLCKKMWYLLQLHARACKESPCSVPRCRDLKEHMRRLQQQSDSRRRAAVNEMMRNRAAEVASNS